MKVRLILLILSLALPGLLLAKAEQVDDYHWTGVERVVVIGDLHGDYQQYLKVMHSAGLIDKKGRWSGGQTHLVQTGDVTDRGDDSRAIIDHLVKLAKAARKKGGYVHMLIGNHEAMNKIGDLRYVTDGEFASYAGRNASKLQDMQWQRQLEWMQANRDDFDTLDLDAYKQEWLQRVPLGWVEHRMAWSNDGEYGKWVMDNPVAVQINDSIFVHGGISAKYCQFSLASLTEQMVTALKAFDPSSQDTIVDDPLGPVWYRGLARDDETDVFTQTVENILTRYAARRMVIGHTPTGGIVWPRFDQRVIANDTGLASYYGAHIGILEIKGDELTAIYGDTHIPLPPDNAGREDYLRAVIDAVPNNGDLKRRLAEMLQPVATDGDAADASDTNKPGGVGSDKGKSSDRGEPDEGEAGEAQETPMAVPGNCW